MALRLPGQHSTAWVIAETGVSAIFSFLSLLVIGRVIGPLEAGVGATAVAAFLVLDTGASLFTDSIVQRPGLTRAHLRGAMTVTVLVGLASGALLAGAGPLWSGWTGHPEMFWLFLALAPLMPLSAYSGASAGFLMRDQRFRLLSLRVLVGQPVALLAGLLAAAHGLGAWAVVINQAVTTGVTFLLMLVFARMPLRPGLERAALADLWPVAAPQIAAVVLLSGRYRLFLLALGLLLAQAVLAQAHFAFRMIDAAVIVIGGAIARIAMPRLCALQDDREALARCYGQIVQLPPMIGLPIALGVALVADDLVAALLGPAWDGTAQAARIVALAACVTFVQGDPFSLFVAIGRARWNFYGAAAGLAIPLLALVIIQPETTVGAALAWSSQAVLLTPVVVFVVLRTLRRSLPWLLRQAAPGLVAGAAMVPPVLLVQAAMEGAPPLTRLLAATAVGGAVFLPVAWIALGRRLPPALRRHVPAATPEPRLAGMATEMPR